MSNKKKAIIGIVIGLIVILISFIAVLLFTNLLFNGKYNLLKEKPVIFEENGETPVEPGDNKTVENQSHYIVKEQSGNDIRNLFKEQKTNWVYAAYDENASITSDFTIVVIARDEISQNERLTIGVGDEIKYGFVDGEFEKDNIRIEYGKNTYDIKILSEQAINVKRNNEEEKQLKLVEKRAYDFKNKNNIVKLYEDTIAKLNNNSELSDEETLKVLAFALMYLDVEKSNKEAIIPDLGYNLAISKERINELLRELVCSGKYQIKDFNNLSKVRPEYYDSLSDESFTGTKEEFAEMYGVWILPSGTDNSGSIVLFSTNNTNFFKVNYLTHQNKKNTLQRIEVKTKTIDGHKCLDY